MAVQLVNHLRTAHKALYIPYNGVPLAAFASIPDQEYLMKHYHTRPNDVYLISYPKAGQHWMKKICIELIRHHDKDKTNKVYISSDIGMDSVPWKETFLTQNGIDVFNKRIEDLKDTLNLWWVHNPYSLFPANKDTLNPETKYIIINRHPKDILISYWSFMNSLDAAWGGFDPKISLNDFFLRFISGTCHYGDYYQWTLDWFNAQSNSMFNCNNNMLFVYYEDILDKPYNSIKEIKDFLYPDDHIITPNDLDNIVELTKFDKMKDDLKINPGSMPFADIHFRKGKQKDWIGYLSDKQSDLMDEIMWIKWAHNGTEIKYYSEVMEKYSDLYNFGYH